MDAIMWTGTPLKVIVNPKTGGPPGKWGAQRQALDVGPSIARDVYALMYEGGATKVLVADDDGKLQWVGYEFYKVAR